MLEEGVVDVDVGLLGEGVVAVGLYAARRRRMSVGGRNFKGVWWMLGAEGGGL